MVLQLKRKCREMINKRIQAYEYVVKMMIESKKIRIKSTKKRLKLVFEEGDDIISEIKNAMAENNVKEAEPKEVHGMLKKLKLNFFQHNKFRAMDFENITPLKISGKLNMKSGEMYGGIHLSINPNNPLVGTIVSATAGKNTEIALEFIEFQEE
ncbi:MAG: hypothetical protein ABIA76_01485 [Candidatus Diapherotrites archaeon]